MGLDCIRYQNDPEFEPSEKASALTSALYNRMIRVILPKIINPGSEPGNPVSRTTLPPTNTNDHKDRYKHARSRTFARSKSTP